jgi:hypothetical protein
MGLMLAPLVEGSPGVSCACTTPGLMRTNSAGSIKKWVVVLTLRAVVWVVLAWNADSPASSRWLVGTNLPLAPAGSW